MDKQYYILSTKHSSLKEFAFTFWGKESSGYYFDLESCQLYTLEEAKARAKSNCEFIVEEGIINLLSEVYVIDNQMVGRVVKNTVVNREILNVSRKDFISNLPTGWDERAFKTPKQYVAENENCIEIFNKCKELVGETK